MTVASGAETVAAVTLLRYEIAVTGDHEGALTRLLESKGYRVEATTIAAIADRPGDYKLIVANGSKDDPGQDVFRRFVANADAAEVSVIFLDTWGISYGSLLHLSKYTGDPPTTGSNYNDGEVSLVSRIAHPLTEGLELGERVEALARETEYAWFSGYGGRSVADVYIGDVGRTVGSGIGYEPREPLERPRAPLAARSEPVDGPDERLDERRRPRLRQRRRLRPRRELRRGRRDGQERGRRAGRGDGHRRRDGRQRGGGERRLLPAAASRGRLHAAVRTGRLHDAGAPGHRRRRRRRRRWTPRSPRAGSARSPGSSRAAAAARWQARASRCSTSGAAAGDDRRRRSLHGRRRARRHLRRRGERRADSARRSCEDVVVADGAATEIAVELQAALRAAVIGDYNNTLTAFLNANEVTATATGWEAVANLDAYDVLILNNPTDPGEAAFLGLPRRDRRRRQERHLHRGRAQLGAAACGSCASTSATRPQRDFVSSDGDPFYEPTVPEPPALRRVLVRTDPGSRGRRVGRVLQRLLGDRAGALRDERARCARRRRRLRAADADERAAAARRPRRAAPLANPAAGWTDDGDRVFLNAVRWAAAPGLSSLARPRRRCRRRADRAARQSRIVETGIETETGPDGSYELPHPPAPTPLR